MDLNFAAAAPGQACYSVSVSADQMPNAFERECVTIEAAPAPARPQLRVETATDAVREVGQKLNYFVTIYNDAATPAENVAIEVLSSTELSPSETTSGSSLIDRGVRWEGERIAARGSLRLQVVYDCIAATAKADIRAYALLSDLDYVDKTDAIEIRAARGGTGGVTPPAPTPRGDLEGVISSTANPATAGEAAVLNIAITNSSATAIPNVQYRLRFDRLLQPANIPGARFTAGVLELPPIASIAPGETFRNAVPFTPIDQGVSTVYLDIRAGATGAPTTVQQSISVRPR